MKKGYYKCTYCDEIFNGEEEPKELEPGTRRALCWDCYKREFMIECELCEEYFYKHESKPGTYYFALMPSDVKQTGMKSGIYRAHSFPVWSSDMFTVTINQENVELITPLDKKILSGDGHTNEICAECFKKYTNQTWLKHKRKHVLLMDIRDAVTKNVSKTIKKHKGDFKYFNNLFRPLMKSINRRILINSRKLSQ